MQCILHKLKLKGPEEKLLNLNLCSIIILKYRLTIQKECHEVWVGGGGAKAVCEIPFHYFLIPGGQAFPISKIN